MLVSDELRGLVSFDDSTLDKTYVCVVSRQQDELSIAAPISMLEVGNGSLSVSFTHSSAFDAFMKVGGTCSVTITNANVEKLSFNAIEHVTTTVTGMIDVFPTITLRFELPRDN